MADDGDINMIKPPFWLAAMLALALTGCASSYVPPEDPYWLASSPATREQIWGPFHDLAGTSWSAPDRYQLVYRWIRPNAVLGEELRNPSTGAVVATNAIMPGGAPGTLRYTSSIFAWDAKVEDASAIVFTQNNAFANMPFRVRRTAQGALVRENVTMRDGVVASVDTSSTFFPSTASPSAVAGNQSPATSAVAAPPAKPGVRQLRFDETVTAEINDQTPSSWGVRYHLYALPARRGEQVVVVTECDVWQNADCWYLNTVSDEAFFFGWSDKTQSPKGSAYQFTLSSDYETIKVANVRGDYDLTYSIYVAKGTEAQQVWNLYKTEAVAFAQERAQREREAERAAEAQGAGNAQMFNAILTGLSQGLAEGAADYQSSQAAQSALLNNIAQTAQAVQAQQTYAAEESDEAPEAELAGADDSGVEAQQDAQVAQALAHARQLASEAGGDPATIAQLDRVQSEIQQRQAKRKPQAGANRILPTTIELSTATNSLAATANVPEPAAQPNNMAAGTVRLCNRPGDEGPAHWPTCPQTRAEEAAARRVAATGTNRTGSATGGSGSGGQESPGRASTSDDEAFAWCTQNKKGFRCWGPYGKMPTSLTLKTALADVGCGYGEGDAPMVGETTRFECNIKKVKDLHGYVPNSPPNW